MKRKTILALMTICILSFASCGKQETTATTETIPATDESVQAETTVTEETITTETEATTEETEDVYKRQVEGSGRQCAGYYTAEVAGAYGYGWLSVL